MPLFFSLEFKGCVAHDLPMPSPWGLCSASGALFIANQVGTTVSVVIKQVDLDKQPKKELIVNETLVMRALHHANIVNYVDSFLFKNEIWIAMEYMEGGCLTDVICANLMSEGQITAVSREIAQGLEHLHEYGIIHRDIKSDNVLLSSTGDIKLSTYHGLLLWYDDLTLAASLTSRLWLLWTNPGSYERNANDYDWYSILDGAGGCQSQGVWPESGYMVSWDHSYRYVSAQFWPPSLLF